MSKTKKITYTAILTAMLVVLSILEASLPLAAVLPPGVKIGLANIAVMYGVFFINKKSGLYLAVCKGLLAFVTRGFTAAVLSASGSLLSVLAVIILLSIFKEKISYMAVSIAAAVCHNSGQLIALYFVLSGAYFYYLPILIVSGIITGMITGTLLRAVMPALGHIAGNDPAGG